MKTKLIVTLLILEVFLYGAFLKKLQTSKIETTYNLKSGLVKWQKLLALEDYLIYIIEEPNQEKMQWGKEIPFGKISAGDMVSTYQNVAYVRIYNKKEKVLVHELLHIKYPKLSEEEIIKLTKEIL